MSVLTRYFFGITAISIALGIQIIVLPWLAVDYLSLSALWVGWVQAALLMPNLLLLLIGGVTADRGKSLSYFVPLLILTAMTHIILVVVVYQHWLSILPLLLYAIILGTISAFIQPWREHLLKKINNDQLQKIIAQSSLCLYGGQAIGVAISSSMDSIGIESLVVIQIILVLGAALFFNSLIGSLTTLKADVIVSDDSAGQSLLKAGLHDVWKRPALRSLVAIAAFNGFFHIGVFIVALPLLASHVYQQPVSFYSSLQFAFVVGTIVATIIIIYKKFLKNPGTRIIFSLLYGGVILLGISAKPTIAGLFTLIFLWGLVVGVSSNMGRSVLQSLAPEQSRGRIISIYQLALFGGAPLGSLFSGYVIEFVGVLTLLKISGIASLLGFTVTLFTRSLWDVVISEETEKT